MYLDYLPREIEIYKRPIQKINSIKYLDTAGIYQTIASNQYTGDFNQTAADHSSDQRDMAAGGLPPECRGR